MIGMCDMGALPEYLPGFQDAAYTREIFSSASGKQTFPSAKGEL